MSFVNFLVVINRSFSFLIFPTRTTLRILRALIRLLFCFNNGGEAGLDLRVGRRPDSCSITVEHRHSHEIGRSHKISVNYNKKLARIIKIVLVIYQVFFFQASFIYGVSDLRKVDRETVSNQ